MEGLLTRKPLAVVGIFENINSKVVQDEERQRRDKMKSSHEAKVERDRTSRQLQLQKAQEIKEKEKKRTQKQERRRWQMAITPERCHIIYVINHMWSKCWYSGLNVDIVVISMSSA